MGYEEWTKMPSTFYNFICVNITARVKRLNLIVARQNNQLFSIVFEKFRYVLANYQKIVYNEIRYAGSIRTLESSSKNLVINVEEKKT